MLLAARLCEAPESIFQAALLFVRYRLSEDLLMDLLADEKPMEKLEALYAEQASALQQLREILDGLKPPSPTM